VEQQFDMPGDCLTCYKQHTGINRRLVPCLSGRGCPYERQGGNKPILNDENNLAFVYYNYGSLYGFDVVPEPLRRQVFLIHSTVKKEENKRLKTDGPNS
jgi:hypothetical protein